MKYLNSILLIDDNPHTNFFNKKLIGKLGIVKEVFVAENGQLALDYLTNQGQFASNGNVYPQPDLIFLDINMPVMDGWEFLEEYAKLPKEQKGNILIIMLTTSPNEEDEKKARSFADVHDYMRKPLTAELLTELMKTYFKD